MPELIVYPEAGSGVGGQLSVDGYARAVRDYAQSLSWAVLRTYAFENDSDDTGDYMFLAQILCDLAPYTDKWRVLGRSIVLFDTSALPADCTIVSAVLSVYGYAVIEAAGVTDVAVYASDPVYDNRIIDADYNSLATTRLSNIITIGNFSVAGYNDFTLNAAGIALISKTGTSKFGFREVTHDALAVAPTWTSGASGYITAYCADKGVDYRPKLTINYSENPVYPSDVLTRVTSLIHRYAQGVYTLQIGLGGVVSGAAGRAVPGDPTIDAEVVRLFVKSQDDVIKEIQDRVSDLEFSRSQRKYRESVLQPFNAPTRVIPPPVTEVNVPYVQPPAPTQYPGRKWPE